MSKCCNGCKSKKCICPPGPTGATGPQGPTGATGASAPSLSARVFSSERQSVDTGVGVRLAFDKERFDDGFHDNVVNNSRLTVPPGAAGKYQITGQAQIEAQSTTGERKLFVFLNNTVVIVASTVTASGLTVIDMNVTTLYDLAVGDFIELFVFQRSGGPAIVEATNDFTPDFMLVRVG